MAATRRGPGLDSPGPRKISQPRSSPIKSQRTDPATVTADNYSAGTLERWTGQREQVLGGLRLARDPHVAAEQLREALGGRALAQAWAHELLTAVCR